MFGFGDPLHAARLNGGQFGLDEGVAKIGTLPGN